MLIEVVKLFIATLRQFRNILKDLALKLTMGEAKMWFFSHIMCIKLEKIQIKTIFAFAFIFNGCTY